MDSLALKPAQDQEHVGAAWPPHLLALIAALAAGIAAQGGFYVAGRLVVAVLVFAALAVALWTARWTRADAGPVTAVAGGLALWTVVSAVLSGGLPAAVGWVLTIGSLVAVLAIVRRSGPAERELVATAVVGLGVLVALTGWAGVAWRLPMWAVLVESRLWRASSALTYSNAAAAVVAPLALLAVALLIARPRSPIRAGAACLLLIGLGATLSRAAALAFVVGLVVLALLAGLRPVMRHTLPVGLGAIVGVGALVPSMPVDAQPRPGIAVAGLLAGLVIAIGPTLLPARLGMWAVVLGAGAIAVAATRVRSDQLDTVLRRRATFESSGRSGAIDSALDHVAAHPLIGGGPGQPRVFWTNRAGEELIGRFVHNEYLQTLIDLGSIGLVLLLALLVALGLTAHRGRRSGTPPLIRAGALAAFAAFALHSGFDFLWHLAVLPLLGVLYIGLAGPVHGEEPAPSTNGEGPP